MMGNMRMYTKLEGMGYSHQQIVDSLIVAVNIMAVHMQKTGARFAEAKGGFQA